MIIRKKFRLTLQMKKCLQSDSNKNFITFTAFRKNDMFAVCFSFFVGYITIHIYYLHGVEIYTFTAKTLNFLFQFS